MDVRGNSVSDSYCDIKELVTERTCNNQPCADWEVEDWSGVSVRYKLKETVTLNVRKSEMQAIIKPCNLLLTRLKSGVKYESYSNLKIKILTSN